MQKLNCVIVEDEPLAADILCDYIHQVPFLHLKEMFKDAITASEFLQTQQADIIFLDIHLPRMKGLDLLRTLSNTPAVIVTTAYHKYAIEGFELNVTDYLLKPFPFNRFLAAINKAGKFIGLQRNEALNHKFTENALFININRRKVKILVDEILFIESKKEYVKIYTETASYTTKLGTKQIEAMLPIDQFKRIHRSFIVAIKKIQTYSRENVEVKNYIIPIGKNFKQRLNLF